MVLSFFDLLSCPFCSSSGVYVAAGSCSSGAGFSGPLDHYSRLIRDGTLRDDQRQRAVLQELEQLQRTLRGYSNTPPSIFSRVTLLLLSVPAENGPIRFCRVVLDKPGWRTKMAVFTVQTLWL